ncbi:ankyrin repeat, SAM and basic leucine zipper domain-containing protein 1 [Wyeomyia smithii]|uniref:ankyrin repeat, SAM and basic leucine zipper domain-containing protein 1 n=1 Tax=Wyeomyia smithii TaxID=174621 RepID=UPI0024680CBD|nr:ankyrin repeat, SAM and basic leucine zipper domain-containing protein 1 [Wyeomyia smithii]
MFRPAGYYSDSEEDSDYSDYGYGEPKTRSRVNAQPAPKPVESNDDLLYQATTEGNLSEVRRIVEMDRYLLNGCLRHGWPVLLLACNEAQYEIVKFLLEEKRVDVNQQSGLKTALMAACESSRSSDQVLKVVELLLEFGAVINCKDSYGTTPLMSAITNGHTEVVKLMLDQASLEATDNEGLTPLFHAVNNNQPEIVQMLLKAGVITDNVNRRGFTPKQEAEFRAYSEVAALLPNEVDFFNVPREYLNYAFYQDISQGRKESEMPGYYQEIGLLLYGMYSEQHLEVFAKEGINLLQFLTLNDENLKRLGFILPFERKKILYGLLKFHRQPWNRNCLKKFGKDRSLDSYDLLELLSNHLKQLTVMQASLLYIGQMMSPAEIKDDFDQQLVICQNKINQFKQIVSSFNQELEHIDSVTVSSPVLHIDATRTKAERFFLWKQPFLCIIGAITTAKVVHCIFRKLYK